MLITIQTEKENDFSSLIDTMSDDYSEFEITFKMLETGLTIKAHRHIVFPKCKVLSSFEMDEQGFYLLNHPIERQYFETFLNLLYGHQMEVTFPELDSIRSFAESVNYSQLEKINSAILNNVDKIPYSFEDNQINVLNDLILGGVFDKDEILRKCKLSQLKRLKDITNDVELLRKIIDAMLFRYTTDTKEIKKYHQNILNNTIGVYETRIHNMKENY